jgi:hypothetical protein
LAETLTYYPSSSGYSSDTATHDGVQWQLAAGSWFDATTTMVQGDAEQIPISDGHYNYYGIAYFDFDSIRTKNVTHYPTRIRIRLKSKTGSTRTAYIHLGKGMATDSYSYGARPVNADNGGISLTYKTVSCPANSWCEINTTDANWLGAIVDSNTTCIYVNVKATATDEMGPHSDPYIEFNGSSTAYKPELIIEWQSRNTAPNPPSSITITPTGFGTGGRVGGTVSIDVSCGDASDAEDAETSLLYQFEYSIAGGGYQILQSWIYDKTATLSLSSIAIYQNIQFRVASRDTSGVVSTYVYTSVYAYKIGAPSIPASIETPTTITTNSKTLNWGASPSYDTSVGVLYEVQLYNPHIPTYDVVVANLDALTTNMNAYTILGLDEANLQYYYSTGSILAVKAVFAQAVQGQTLSSGWRYTDTFTIDYRITPTITSFTVDYTASTKLYEGIGYTISLTKGNAGNQKDVNGDAQEYSYYAEILYGTGYSQSQLLYWSPNYLWGTLPATVDITVPSNIVTTIDTSVKLRVRIINSDGLLSYATDAAVTLKRYRTPSVNIKSFTRNSTDFSITFDITDTGLNDQDVADITSAIATFNSVPISYTFASSLTNLVITFDAGDGITAISSGIVTLVVLNNSEDSMTDKSGSDTQSIPQHVPNLRIASSGVYLKTAGYVWDSNGVAHYMLIDTGWIPANETWTYASATTFTISGNQTSRYGKGDKLMWTQNGAVRYNSVYSSTYNAGTGLTTIIVHSGYQSSAGDCAILDTATYPITVNYYSKMENPNNWPDIFNFAPILSATGSMTYTDAVVSHCSFSLKGHICHFDIDITGTTGGTASNSLLVDAPITPLNARSGGGGITNDGGAYILGYWFISSNVILLRKNDSSNYGLDTGRTFMVGGSFNY